MKCSRSRRKLSRPPSSAMQPSRLFAPCAFLVRSVRITCQRVGAANPEKAHKSDAPKISTTSGMPNVPATFATRTQGAPGLARHHATSNSRPSIDRQFGAAGAGLSEHQCKTRVAVMLWSSVSAQEVFNIYWEASAGWPSGWWHKTTGKLARRSGARLEQCQSACPQPLGCASLNPSEVKSDDEN